MSCLNWERCNWKLVKTCNINAVLLVVTTLISAIKLQFLRGIIGSLSFDAKTANFFYSIN